MNEPSPVHPSVARWVELGLMLGEEAMRQAARTKRALRPARRGAFATRRPGAETPMWNLLTPQLREALKPFGAKARLARYLGIPRQRLNDYLTRRNRLPDAETTLQMLAWLAEKRAGRDSSL
jgi:hypothetical protein